MQKWEYKTCCLINENCIDKEDGGKAKSLNDLGREGWELIQIVRFNIDNMALFKRPYSEIRIKENVSLPLNKN